MLASLWTGAVAPSHLTGSGWLLSPPGGCDQDGPACETAIRTHASPVANDESGSTDKADVADDSFRSVCAWHGQFCPGVQRCRRRQPAYRWCTGDRVLMLASMIASLSGSRVVGAVARGGQVVPGVAVRARNTLGTVDVRCCPWSDRSLRGWLFSSSSRRKPLR